MATNSDDQDMKSANQENLKRSSMREKVITKKTKKKSSVKVSTHKDGDLIVQSLKAIDRSPHFETDDGPASMCKCRPWDSDRATNIKCGFCLTIEVDPAKVLPKSLIVTLCHKCGNYYYHPRRAICRASPQSTELLTFLTKIFERWLRRTRLVLLDAHFFPPDPLSSQRIKIKLNLQRVTPTGEKVDLTWIPLYYIKHHECLPCMLKNAPKKQRSVVELRPYGTSNSRQSLLKLEEIILRYGPTLQLVDHERYGEYIRLYFPEERHVKYFVAYISTVTPIQPNKVCRMLLSGSPRDRRSEYFHTCLPLLISPLRFKDLVFLPSKVSAKLGNIGPLVICTGVDSSIRLLDPFKLSVCALSADQYWNEPFEPLKTREELVKFIVLNVEVVSKGPNFSLADIKVARVSDFGKNDVISSVRSHLGEILKPGDHAYGYVLNWENISHVEAEKCRDSLPDVVLVRKKRGENEQPMEVEKKTKKNTSPEYLEFLSNLEKNPEAMFNLSLKCGNDDEKGMADMEKGKNVDLDLEDMLADLGLSDEEDGESNRK